MKKLITTLAVTVALMGCANMTPQQRALLSSAETIASVAATAAATVYGGPAAGALASAGLSALGSVLQSYVGLDIPTSVVHDSPGIAGVGVAVADILPKKQVSQKTVDTVNRAASIAAGLKAVNVLPFVAPTAVPAPSPTP